MPLRLCTLYAGEDGVREMLAGERDAFAAALDHLAGRQEWGVKVTVDRELVTEAARARHQGAKAALPYKFDFDPFRDQSCLETHVQQLLRGFWNYFAGVHREVIDVHADELLRQVRFHVARELHRVL